MLKLGWNFASWDPGGAGVKFWDLGVSGRCGEPSAGAKVGLGLCVCGRVCYGAVIQIQDGVY